jgi:hypothetical protein
MEVYNLFSLAIIMCMKPNVVKEKVTLESIARSISKLATKEEISKLATKDELSSATSKLATKDELSSATSKLATKDELSSATSKLATKDELRSATSKLATKDELSSAISKLATKDELHKAVSGLATRDEMNKVIDDLAGAVKKGFDEVHGKFTEVNEHLAKIDFKIERMDTRFTNQLDYFDLWYPTKYEFTNLDNRMTKVEKRLRIKA